MAQLTIEQVFHLAVQHHQAGRLVQAEQLYREILARQANHADALHYLGLIAAQVGRNESAVELIRQAIVAKPDYPQAFSNLGIALRANGQIDEAIAAFREAISLDPNLSEAHCNLGSAMKDNGELDEAIAAYRRAIALSPGDPQAHSNLGNVLTDKGQFAEAIAACRKSIILDPNRPEAHDNLGAALQATGQLDEAMAAYRRAIALQFDFAQAHYNLGSVLQTKGQVDEAIAEFRRAIDIQPGYAEAHWNLALALLARGEFTQGWEEYEWRWRCKSFISLRRNFFQPQWDGRPLAGATILLHVEQGFGDTIQFIRYLPQVERRGGRIIIECQPELRRLIQSMAVDYHVVTKGQPLPAFELHCPLGSLPRIFMTALDTAASEVPYLFPDGELLECWRQRLGASVAGLRVALAWAGNPNFKDDRTRSLSLDRLAPLADVRGATFYSIQKGEPARQADHPPAGLQVVNLEPQLHDFADTAAAICSMDLVITTDTSVAHLAGALGRPVWVMLQFVPDWRWLLERQDSPWYPTMRLFRQTSNGGWESVVQRVSKSLNNQ